MNSSDQNATLRHFTIGNGQRIAATEQGSRTAPSIILLHGAGQTRHSWKGTVPALATRGYHVLALDARGHGDSSWPEDADYSVDALAGDLSAIVATLAAPPVLVGASMGGLTALHAITRGAPRFALGLVLVDIVPNMNRPGAQRVSGFMQAHAAGFASVDDAADAVAAYNPHRPRPRDVSGLMKNLRRHPDGRLYWHWDPKFFARPASGTRGETVAKLMAASATLTLPVLLVRGAESEIVTPANASDFKAVLPQLEVLDVPGAGHMIAGDSNDHFVHGVLNFLGQIQ